MKKIKLILISLLTFLTFNAHAQLPAQHNYGVKVKKYVMLSDVDSMYVEGYALFKNDSVYFYKSVIIDNYIESDTGKFETLIIGDSVITAVYSGTIPNTLWVENLVNSIDTVPFATKSDTANIALELLRESELVSRTIYVDSASGNDLTGAGTLLLPYETIGRALDDIKYYIVRVKITIQLGEGTYDFTDNDMISMYNHYTINSIIPIEILGTYEILESGLTITVSGSNPFIYNVSGVTWTSDEYKKCFVARTGNTSMYPIFSNTANTLTCSYASYTSMTEIRKIRTKINLGTTLINMTPLSADKEGEAGLSSSYSFKYIQFNTDAAIVEYNKQLSIDNCLIITSSGNGLMLNGSMITNTYIMSTYSGGTVYVGLVYALANRVTLTRCILENLSGNYGSSVYVSGNDGMVNFNASNILAGSKYAINGSFYTAMIKADMYIVGNENFISSYQIGNSKLVIDDNIKIYLNNVDYLFNFQGNAQCENLEYVDETVSLISDFNPASTIQEYVNVGKNISIEVLNNGFQTNLTDTIFIFRDSTINYIMQGVIPDTNWVLSKIDTAGAASIAFDGDRTVTRSDIPNINAGGETVVEFIENYFFPSTNPTATLSVSGGYTREFMTAGADLSVDLTWSVTRIVACPPIDSIKVNIISQILDSPFDEGHTQSDVLASQALPRNTNTTYYVYAYAGENSGSASRTVSWSWKRYWGAFASAVPPTDPSFSISDADILALTGAGIGTGNEFASTRVKSYDGIDGAGDYLVFAFLSSWGTPTFIINGLPSTAFTKVREDAFTNATGGSTTIQVWVTNTEMNSPIIDFEIQ